MLTRRQYDVAKTLAETTLVHKEIADKLNVSVRTVRYYTMKVYQEFGLHERLALVQFWAKNQADLDGWLAYVRWATRSAN